MLLLVLSEWASTHRWGGSHLIWFLTSVDDRRPGRPLCDTYQFALLRFRSGTPCCRLGLTKIVFMKIFLFFFEEEAGGWLSLKKSAWASPGWLGVQASRASTVRTYLHVRYKCVRSLSQDNAVHTYIYATNTYGHLLESKFHVSILMSERVTVAACCDCCWHHRWKCPLPMVNSSRK